MSNMKLLRDVVDSLQGLADSITTMADAMENNEPYPDEDKVKSPLPSQGSVPEQKIVPGKSQQVTLDQLHTIVSQLLLEEKRSQVKALLLKYNASKISEIATDDYKSFMAEAVNL